MTRSSIYVLATILLVALGLRFWWTATQTPVISIEGVEYVRMAENLRSGQGLKGNFESPETMYKPLYPVMIAGVLFFTKNAELAGHVVAAVVGAALVLPLGSMRASKRQQEIKSSNP